MPKPLSSMPAASAEPSAQRTPADLRRGVARTAWVVGGIALAIYLAFVLSGVLGR